MEVVDPLCHYFSFQEQPYLIPASSQLVSQKVEGFPFREAYSFAVVAGSAAQNSSEVWILGLTHCNLLRYWRQFHRVTSQGLYLALATDFEWVASKGKHHLNQCH